MKTIIFDIDGTIFDTKVGIINCLNDVLKTYGKEIIPEIDQDKYIGPAIKESLVKYNNFSEELAIEATNQYRKKYVEKYVSESIPYTGLIELLTMMKKKGIRICIATMKTRNQVDRLFEFFEISSLFDIIETAKYEGGYTKVDMLDGIKKAYGEDDYLFVGDTNGDFQASKKVGIPFVFARYGYGAIDGYEGVSIDRLSDLLSLI